MNKKNKFLLKEEYRDKIFYFMAPFVLHYRLFEKHREEGNVEYALINYDIASHLQEQIDEMHCHDPRIKWLQMQDPKVLANICENLIVMQSIQRGCK